MKTVRMFYNFSYFSTFYTLFLQFFVQEIFKFKYDKFFVRNSASISKFKWFEQPWYFHKLQFISHKLFPSSSPHEQLCELVFFFSCTNALIVLNRHIRLFKEPAIWALLFFSLMTAVLCNHLVKCTWNVLHIKLMMSISWSIKKYVH